MKNDEYTSIPHNASPMARLLFDLKFAEACQLALQNFNGKNFLFNRSILECEQAGVVRAEVLEDFYFLGLFDLETIDNK